MLAVLSAPLLLTGPAVAAEEGSEIPVVAVARGDASTAQSSIPNGRYEFAVHGVYRYDGGTVAYWSVRSDTAYDSDELSDPRKFHWRRGNFENSGFGISEASLVVRERGELYTTLLADEGAGICLCTNALVLDDDEPQEWQTVYAAFAELPAEVTRVSMHLDGYGTVVHDVPVSDGLPQPQVDAETVPVGQGWPTAPDADAVEQAAADRSGGPIWVLHEPGGAADGSWRSTSSGEEETVDISADVLFDFDEATITAAADRALDDVAARIRASGARSATVIGHTDSTGDEAYNQDLSERRAHAVEQALKSRLPGIALAVEGRGETEPVAPNDTDENRALNRRVTVVFVGGED
ncbi:hypothetical protein GCM10022383_28960 [Microbacterium soli]|uniref:OmpA-like domain-containing protein n=2 Tax=Microbacterium soli TaxID=446075 RepID=A0ABP7NKZ1_9MICO